MMSSTQDYAPYSKTNLQQLDNQTYQADKTPSSKPYQISSPSKQTINILSGKIDYSYQLLKLVAMESGFKYTNIVSNNRFDFFNVPGGVQTPDLSRSDRFEYTENTGAAYTYFTHSSGKWNFKGGVRAEYTRTAGLSFSLDSTNRNDYLRLFPTVAVNYKAASNHEFGFSYSKRIERPDYRQLNPARSYSNPYNYWSGNPFLRPAIINDVRISCTLLKEYTIAAVYTKQITCRVM